MENTLLVGLSRQVALARQLDVVANNVANLNTTGFKSDGSLFEEYIGPTARENGFRGAVEIPESISLPAMISCEEGDYVHAIVQKSVTARDALPAA